MTHHNSSDPFRPEQSTHFRLNIGAASHPHHPVEHQHHAPSSDEYPQQPKNFHQVFKNGLHQLVASIIIFVVGFLLMNSSAYYQIIKTKVNELIGGNEINPLEKYIDESATSIVISDKLSQSTDQYRKIPALNIEVAPSDDRIIIPRIDQNLPIVRVNSENLIKRNWNALEKDMQEALRDGVVHYPGTSLPGQSGNIAITGHSSYFPWDSGRFKDVFALLHNVVEGDKIVIYYNQDKYVYQVDNIEVVLPNDINILKQTPEDKLTLITCTPVGTNLKRLVVTAKPVSTNTDPEEMGDLIKR